MSIPPLAGTMIEMESSFVRREFPLSSPLEIFASSLSFIQYDNRTITPTSFLCSSKMMTKSFLMAILALLTTSQAFTSPQVFGVKQRVSRTAVDAVIDIGSEGAFDKTIKDSGSALVIVDYSTTWCGPCKGVFQWNRFFLLREHQSIF